MERSQEYQSYLLRLWREDDAMEWRASLQSTATGEMQGFASLADLIAYLQSQAVLPVDPPDGAGESASPLAS
jgi:hypothetical protein